MISQQKTDLVITPATWPRQENMLQKTSTGLLHVVGWFGSTHASAMWRKADEFLAVFQDKQVPGFDPQIDDWNPAFATTEAEIMAQASVIIIRLENNELLNGSLGSIAETGLALTSAALRGQIIIISIEDKLLTTLDEPGAIAMYMVLEMALENLARVDDVAGNVFRKLGADRDSRPILSSSSRQRPRKAGHNSLSGCPTTTDIGSGAF